MNERLISQRKEAKLTQMQVAKAAGITDRQYQRYEAGTASPDVRIAKKIAKAFGCLIEDIF